MSFESWIQIPNFRLPMIILAIESALGIPMRHIVWSLDWVQNWLNAVAPDKHIAGVEIVSEFGQEIVLIVNEVVV